MLAKDSMLVNGSIEAAPEPTAPYVPNLPPLPLHFDVCAQVGQRIIAGKLAPSAAGAEADRGCGQWRSRNADQVPVYEEWIGDVRTFEPEESGR